MTAVDTNVLIRLLTQDQREQAAAAGSLFASERIWIAKTVLLETSWVLRSAYGFQDGAVREAFTMLLGLSNVQVEDEAAVSTALAFMHAGLEFADALHLSSRPPGATFVSFDRAFARRARRAGIKGVAEVPRRT